eukprot:gene4974-5215_t
MAAMVAAHVAEAASDAAPAASSSQLAAHQSATACHLGDAHADCVQAGDAVLEQGSPKEAEVLLLQGLDQAAIGEAKVLQSSPVCGLEDLQVHGVGPMLGQLPASKHHVQVSSDAHAAGCIQGPSAMSVLGAAIGEEAACREGSRFEELRAAAAGPAALQQRTLLSLLDDDVFMHQLLASLPGVSGGHPQVLWALALLRAWLQQQ